jgi:AraC family transcriptional regulator
VNSTRIQPISKGRRLPYFSSPGFTSADHAWAGYSFEEANGNGEPMPSHSWAKTTLLYVTGGQGSLSWKHRGIWREDPCPPGTVSIIRRDVEIQSAVPSCAFPIMVMQLDNLKLQGIAPDHVRTIEKSLESAQVTSDCRLGALLSEMCEEVREGCPSGRLYGESISLALLAYLSGTYATPRPADGNLGNKSFADDPDIGN